MVKRDMIKATLQQPQRMFLFVIAVSGLSLGAALTAEVALGLEPCILCLYQRGPFVTAILLAAIGLYFRGNPRITSAILGLCGLNFLVNAGIAFYHSGVELKWWRSAVEGCAVPQFGDSPQSILENILSAPTARCDEIPWADPVFGLSMANYNVLLCFGLFAVCTAAALMQRPSRSAKT